MIRIGLSQREKQKELDAYLAAHEIKKVYCFHFKNFPAKYKTEKEIEYIEYADIEMYKFFYRLLEEIDDKSLIIMDGCMRTQDRNELTYNCAHHYLNQTPHHMIFEFFPFIEDKNDIMILLDFENKGKYKGKSFEYGILQTEDVQIKPFKIRFEPVNVEITEKDTERYKAKKEQLFETLGAKDPDTIPRALQLFAGDLKKKAVEPGQEYVARNKRFGLANVKAYGDIKAQGQYTVIDTHYRRLSFNDFLRTTRMNKIRYLATPLPIDDYIMTDFIQWKARLDAVYAQANLYR